MTCTRAGVRRFVRRIAQLNDAKDGEPRRRAVPPGSKGRGMVNGIQVDGQVPTSHRAMGEERSDGNLAPALVALCAIARFHQVSAEPASLAHQLGLAPSVEISADDLLRAAKHLGLKAKLTTSSVERLSLVPMPALALLRRDNGHLHAVILAQCDGQRVLVHDAAAAVPRPTIEPVSVFSAKWTGELILIASRANLVGDLSTFDFSWFVPAIVKYRRLLGEVLLISFFLQLFALVSPLFFQVVMDKVLVHRAVTTLDVLVAGLLGKV
jgi:ATP-binding cassette, subfamily B, bacterial HlyB/CyaB